MTDRKQIGDWAGTPTAMSSRRCHHSATAARSKQIWAARLRERSEILRNRQEAGETVSQSKSVAWRGGRSGETKSTTKPSGQERPLGFVHFNAVSSSQLCDRRRSDAKTKSRRCQSSQSAETVRLRLSQVWLLRSMLPLRLNVPVAPPDMVR